MPGRHLAHCRPKRGSRKDEQLSNLLQSLQRRDLQLLRQTTLWRLEQEFGEQDQLWCFPWFLDRRPCFDYHPEQSLSDSFVSTEHFASSISCLFYTMKQYTE